MGPDSLTAWIARFSYPAIFVLLVACGVGAPLSEELILITGGLVAAHGHGRLAAMVGTGIAGTLAGDLLLYQIGLKLSLGAVAREGRKKLLTPGRVAWIQGHFTRYGSATLFVARFLPGLRAPTFLVAGIARLGLRRFLLADGAGVLITAPLLVWLGYRFGVAILQEVREASHGLLLAAGVLILALAGRKVLRRRRRLRAGEAEAAAQMLRRELGEETRQP